MSDSKETIGLQELLDEVSRDLDDFRKKHASDYGVKNVTLWWELERERLSARFTPATVVKKLKRVASVKRLLAVFSLGWLAMLVAQAGLRLLLP